MREAVDGFPRTQNGFRRGYAAAASADKVSWWGMWGNDLLAVFHPVFYLDVLDVQEVLHVLGHQHHLLGNGGAAYQQVELASGCAGQGQRAISAA